MSVPGKLGFCQEKLTVVLPVGATECGAGVCGGAAAVVVLRVVERRWVVLSLGVEALGVRRRRTGDCCSSAVVAAVVSSAAGAAIAIVEGVAGVVRPLPTTVYPAGTETLIWAVKRLVPYPFTGNQRPGYIR